MTEPIAAAYGSWTSPISAGDLAASSHPVAGGCFVGDEIWWLELRPAEGGRYAVRRLATDGEPEDILPAPWNARSRVHEYGGGAWTVTADGVLIFAEFTDQRLYRMRPGAAAEPLTPSDCGFRFAELSIAPTPGGEAVWAVRETHHDDDSITRDIVTVPLDGSAATDAARITSVVSGSHFLAYPRRSPDGTRLAWIAWEHPQMPWDGTELRVGTLGADGVVSDWRSLVGSSTESVLQPEWIDDNTLYALSDRTGFWNLYRVTHEGAATALTRLEADLGGPLWTLGQRWYRVRADGRILAVLTHGNDRLAVIDANSGVVADIDTGMDAIALCDERPDETGASRALVVGGSARLPRGLRVLEFDRPPTDGAASAVRATDIRLGADQLPDLAVLPTAEAMVFPSGDHEVHAFVYRPHNPDFVGLPGELAPFVAFVHGGPTAHVRASLSLSFAYFTSRGIGVVDVNYGGSSGYGRAYRERLRSQWGILDVQDTIAVVQGLADVGIADVHRLAIEGGSAGGWTVLAALTSSDAFAAGVSYYGVAELTRFAAETHDFESRYLDGLIGPLPEAAELYESRAPLNNVASLNTPVLLLQGLDDPIVPPSQAERFRDALAAKGIRHAYVTYEGESHGFRRVETLVHSREAELSFYGQVLGFTPPGIPQLPLEG